MVEQRLSVAMCTYNGTRFLWEQLDSIASQTRLPDELVVCDDGSTDATLAILTEYGRAVQFPMRIQCNAKRLGVVKNFEQAISLCGGDIIVLGDQDDVWRQDKLQILEHVLSENPDAGYAFSDALVINETGKLIHPSLWEQVPFGRPKRAIFSRSPAGQIRVLLKGNVVTGATMAFKSSLKTVVLPVPDSWLHDEWFALASNIKGTRGIPIQEPLIYYRQHEAQAAGVAPGLLKAARQSLLGDPRAYRLYDLRLCKWSNAYALLKSKASQDPPMLHLPRWMENWLEAKVAHEVFRSKLCRQPRLARIKAIVAALTRGQYHFHSQGWESAIRDLLIPAIGDSLGA